MKIASIESATLRILRLYGPLRVVDVTSKSGRRSGASIRNALSRLMGKRMVERRALGRYGITDRGRRVIANLYGEHQLQAPQLIHATSATLMPDAPVPGSSSAAR